MRKDSVKYIRINEELQKELSLLIQQEVKDPRIDALASVSKVEVTTDLKMAKVYVTVLAEDKKESTMKGLKNAASFLRSRLAKNLNLRNTPELFFYLDESYEKGLYMSNLIDEVTKGIREEDDGETE